MTLFVVLGLVAVVVGVLVAVALGVRSMRADGRGESDYWDSPDADSDMADLDDLDDAPRRGQGRRTSRRRPSIDDEEDDYDRRRGGYDQVSSRRGRAADDFDRGAAPGYKQAATSRAYDEKSVLGAGANAARAAGRPPRAALPAANGSHSGRRRPPQKEQKEEPTRRSRPSRGRGGDGDSWNDTNWERVSDEDYWAELSADKPLASRTAQSAADLRSPDPEPETPRESPADHDVRQPEPQTATMAMPEYGAVHGAGTDLPGTPATLPVRRSGKATDPGGFPSVGGIAGHVPADYSDPNLAVLASLSGPAAGGQAAERGAPLSAPTMAQGPADPPNTPAGAWPASGQPQGDWSYGGQDPAFGNGRHSGPEQTYGTQSYGVNEPGTYAGSTPGYGLAASPGYAAANPMDAATGVAQPAYGAMPDQSAGQAGGYADMNGAYGGQYGTGSNASAPGTGYGTGTGSYAESSYGASYDPAQQHGMASLYDGTSSASSPSYGTASAYGTAPPYGAPGSYGNTSYDSPSYDSASSYSAAPTYGTAPSYGAPGSYDSTSYDSAPSHASTSSYGTAQPETSWSQADASAGTAGDGGWQYGWQQNGQPGGAPSAGGYATPSGNGHTGAYPAAPHGAPVGGVPAGSSGSVAGAYPVPSPPAGFPTGGYLSSSALSARQDNSDPEPPLAGTSSGNPYGSYVTDPVNPPDAPGVNDSYQPLPHGGDTSGYRGQTSYGGYGDYGGGTHR